MYGNGKIKDWGEIAVFKQLILEELWLSCFGSYLQSWGVKDTGEVGGTKKLVKIKVRDVPLG